MTKSAVRHQKSMHIFKSQAPNHYVMHLPWVSAFSVLTSVFLRTPTNL